MKTIGVDIIQPMVPHYRAPLFEGLASASDLKISIQSASEWPLGQRSVSLYTPHYFPNRNIHAITGTPLLWQEHLSLINANQPGDVLVIAGDLHFLSNLPLIQRAKSKGVGIIWWGHHWSATTNGRFFIHRLNIVKNLADCFLLYTKTGVESWAKFGFPPDRLFYTGNCIDMKPIEESTRRWTPERLAEFQSQNNIHPNTLLFTSVLNPKVHLDTAFRALAEITEFDYEFVVIGDGPMGLAYRQIAQDLGIARRVRWLGEIREEDRLAPWFLSAKSFVYPGTIGLSLLHAFSYGLSVITHGNLHNHGPEIEAFLPGVNGLAFQENDPRSLAEQIRILLSDAVLRNKLSQGALEKAGEYGMDRMIQRFHDCLLACSRLSSQR